MIHRMFSTNRSCSMVKHRRDAITLNNIFHCVFLASSENFRNRENPINQNLSKKWGTGMKCHVGKDVEGTPTADYEKTLKDIRCQELYQARKLLFRDNNIISFDNTGFFLVRCNLFESDWVHCVIAVWNSSPLIIFHWYLLYHRIPIHHTS